MKPPDFDLYIFGNLSEHHYNLWKSSLPDSEKAEFTDRVRAVKVYKQKEAEL